MKISNSLILLAGLVVCGAAAAANGGIQTQCPDVSTVTCDGGNCQSGQWSGVIDSKKKA